METELKVDNLKSIYGDDFIDVTDRVVCYENGKTFECDCGQGFGLPLNQVVDYCPSCHTNVVDAEADSREPPEMEETQTSLSQW